MIEHDMMATTKDHNREENQVEARNSVARNDDDDDDSDSSQSQSTSDIPGAHRVGGIIGGEDSVTIVVGSVGTGADGQQPQEGITTAQHLGIMEPAIEEDNELIEAYKVEEDTAEGNSNGRSNINDNNNNNSGSTTEIVHPEQVLSHQKLQRSRLIYTMAVFFASIMIGTAIGGIIAGITIRNNRAEPGNNIVFTLPFPTAEPTKGEVEDITPSPSTEAANGTQ